MPQMTLKQRVEKLEQEMAAMKASSPGPNDWRSTVGMFAGDELMREIFDEALKYRERDRQKARRRFAKRKGSK